MTITLKDVGSGFKRTAINENFDAIEAELNNNVLRRDSATGNQMEANIDMNSNRLVNLVDAINGREPVTLDQLNGALSAASSGLIAAQQEQQTGADIVGSVTTFTGITYTVSSNNLYVFRNGNYQTKGVDYNETSTSSITWTTVPNATDRLVFITNLATTNSVADTAAITHTEAGAGYNLATYLHNRHVVSVKDFGAVGDGTTDDYLACQAALDSGNHVYFPPPSVRYLTTQTLNIGSNQVVFGGGMGNTNVQGSASGTPTKIFEFESGSKKSYLRDINVTWVGASDVGVSIFESSKITIDSVGGNALNQDSGAGTTHGTFIKMDMGTVTSAYTHAIRNCDSQGADVYIDSTGPITGCLFENNKGRAANGLRFSKGSQPGSAPIAGNKITGNLIQAYSSATFGTGVGIDFGVGDATSPTHTFANYIENNYIERWATGVLFRDGAKNNFVGANEWDNNTADITDSNSAKDGYSEVAGTKKFIKIAEYSKEFRPYGDRYTNHKTGAIGYDGDKIFKQVNSDGETVTPSGRTLRIDGNGSARTGAILDLAADDVDGQTLVLLGLTWSVAFASTNLDPAAGFTLGNAGGQLASATLQWDKTNQKWVMLSSVTR